jgi:hypothetical protein
MTHEEIEEKLLDAHQVEADEHCTTIHNFGWGQSDYGICSKTSQGYLESEIDPDTLKITHSWEAYS